MGRPRKQNREPFWRSDRSCYYVQHGTRQVRLSPDKDEAWRLWHEFMARPPEPDGPRQVSKFEFNLVRILRFALGQWPADQGLQLVRAAIARPECLRPPAVHLVNRPWHAFTARRRTR